MIPRTYMKIAVEKIKNEIDQSMIMFRWSFQWKKEIPKNSYEANMDKVKLRKAGVPIDRRKS